MMNDNVVVASDKRSPFLTALADRQRARAEVSACEAALTEENEEEINKAQDEAAKAQREAEWKLIRTPARGIVDIRERAMIVRELFYRATWADMTDEVDMLMLGVLISEILSPIAED